MSRVSALDESGGGSPRVHDGASGAPAEELVPRARARILQALAGRCG